MVNFKWRSMWWQAPTDAYDSVIQPSLTVTVARCFYWYILKYKNFVSHNNNKHTNSARKFPGDFANFQKIYRISRRKNNSSRFPGFLGVLRHPVFKKNYCPTLPENFTKNASTTFRINPQQTAKPTHHNRAFLDNITSSCSIIITRK